jgi:signal transduction histidine kinase
MSAAAAGLVCALPGQAFGIALMAAIGLLSAWTIARLASKRIRRRLHELREATDALSGDKLLHPIHALPNDDCLKLSTSLERLSSRLARMLEERDQLRQRLGRSEKLAVIGELSATVAHEVNNPLDGLQNSIRIIRRRAADDPQTRQLLDMMEQGLARIETTVRRLLSMSRDEPIKPKPTPVEAIIDDAVLFVQPRLNRYGIRLVRDFSLEPVIVHADGVHMAQVLINLMINAADAMKETGGQLTVSCQHADVDGKARLNVVDTGCGIEEHHLPHIFEPFYSTKTNGTGTGLGLSVVARVVEAHGGRIEVQTEPGKGTCFCIELPATAVPGNELPRATREASAIPINRSGVRVSAVPTESI